MSLRIGNCSNCFPATFRYVQACHPRNGWQGPLLCLPPYSTGDTDRRWLTFRGNSNTANITTTYGGITTNLRWFADVTTAKNYWYSTMQSIGAGYSICYASESDGASYPNEKRRFYTYRWEFTVDAISGQVTVAEPVKTVIPIGGVEWLTVDDGTTWLTGTAEHIDVSKTDSTHTTKIRVQFGNSGGTWWNDSGSLTWEESSNENTDAAMLSLLDTMLSGPWYDYHRNIEGVDWSNPLYFDAAHNSGYFARYVDSRLCIYDDWAVVPSQVYKHAYVGYQLQDSSGGTGSECTKTRMFIHLTADATQWTNDTPTTKAGATIATRFAPIAVFETLNTTGDYDKTTISAGCELDDQYDAPDLSGKQRWYHIAT